MPKEPKKEWTLNDWLSNFLSDPHPYYHGAAADDDDYDDTLPDGMPGGDDDYYDTMDESIIESLIIVGLAAALAWLVYYRQRRQQRAGNAQYGQGQRQEDVVANVDGGMGVVPEGGPNGQVVEGQQADGGFFPPPDDPGFGHWAAGGVGH